MRLLRVVHPVDRSPRHVLWYLAKLVVMPAARLWRRRLRRTTRFVGVTGSAGKTTTRNLLVPVLGTLGPTIGDRMWKLRTGRLTRAVFLTRPRHRFSVFEVQATGPDSLDELLWTLEPDVAVITNAGMDHYSAFRGPDGVAAEKGKLVAAVPPGGLAVLNADDERVRAMASRTTARVITYGRTRDADVRAEDVSAVWPGRLSFTLVAGGERHPVRTRLVGEGFLTSVLAALACGIGLGGRPADLAAAVAAVEPEPHRLSVYRTSDGVTFVQDDWKASEWTLPPALDMLRNAPGRRIAVIGQLSDHPAKPKTAYARVARQALESADLVLMVGRWAHYGLRAGDRVTAVSDAVEAHEWLQRETRPGDLVLLKATHEQLHLERLPLAMDGLVGCWRRSCDRVSFCERCELVRTPFDTKR